MKPDIKEGGPRHETASTMMTPTTDNHDYNRDADNHGAVHAAGCLPWFDRAVWVGTGGAK